MKWTALCVAGLIAFSACSDSNTKDPDECGPNGTCPPGFTCNPVNNRCIMTASLIDARPADSRPGDAGAADARADAGADAGAADAAVDAAPMVDARPALDAGGPPMSTILTGAPNGVSAASVTFTYSSNTAGSTFECGLDGTFAACDAGGRTFTGLADKSTHTFQVRATAGGVTGPPASRMFTVDAAGPVITISAPASPSTVGAMVTFSFSSNEPATLTCTVDTAPVASCTTGFTRTLAGGSHTFVVSGVDAVGNTGSATATFTVDDDPPSVAFVSPLEFQIVCPAFEMQFEANPPEVGASYACGIDTGATEECNDGTRDFSGISDGEHTLKVVATDQYGNSSTITEGIVVDATEPMVEIEPPPGPVCSSGTLTYSASDPGGIGGAVDVVDCAVTSGQCSASNGALNFTGLASGTQTVTLSVSDACGNVGVDQLQLTVDSTGPTFNNLAATPGAADSGTATLTFTTSEPTTSVTGGLALVTPLSASPPASDLIPGSCSCSTTGCSCSQLAAGTNVLAVRGTDACGNAGAFTTTTVNSNFGSYAGHAVLIGHDYADPNTPDPLVANAVALTPLIKRSLPINRNARVLAFRPATSDGPSVSNVLAAVETKLGAKFDMNDAVSYREISDGSLLPSMVRGRDVVLLFDPKGSLTNGQLDTLGAAWETPLVNFTNGGGIVVALSGAVANSTAGQTWRLVTFVNVTGASAIPLPDAFSSHTNNQMYPASTVVTNNFYIAQGAPTSYNTPSGSSCFSMGDQMAAVVYELFSDDWNGDGTTLSFCSTVLDQAMPEYTLSVAVTKDVVPGIPSCVPAISDSTGGGTITVTPQGGQPSPGTTFECYYGDRPDGDTTGFPVTNCTAGTSTFTYDTPAPTSVSIWLLRIALIHSNEPERITTVPFAVDERITVSVTGPGGHMPHWCQDDFTVSESAPFDLDEYDPACAASWTQYPAQPVKSVTCQLLQHNGTSYVVIATKTGTNCGLSLYDSSNVNGGFMPGQGVVNWRPEICATNAANGNYQMTVTVEDYHGNMATETGSWFENPQTPTFCCP